MAARAAERIGANAKAAGERSVGLHRLVRRDGDRAVLKLSSFFQLLNRVLEGGVADALERTADALAPWAGRLRPSFLSSAAVTS